MIILVNSLDLLKKKLLTKSSMLWNSWLTNRPQWMVKQSQNALGPYYDVRVHNRMKRDRHVLVKIYTTQICCRTATDVWVMSTLIACEHDDNGSKFFTQIFHCHLAWIRLNRILFIVKKICVFFYIELNLKKKTMLNGNAIHYH